MGAAATSIALLIIVVAKYALHSHRQLRLQRALLRYGGSHIVVMIIPWYLEEPRIEEGLEQEETPPASVSAVDQQ